MTAHKYVTIWCNGDGCAQFQETEHHRVVDARRALSRSGWRHLVGGRDLCPTCAQKIDTPAWERA